MNERGKIKIGRLFNIEKGSLQSSKCVSGDYDFITASSEWKTHKEYSHHTEALIVAVAASGSLGRVHYVNGKFISSDLCFILTPKDEIKYPIDLGFYLHIFKVIRQDLVQRTATGTSKLAINKGNFENYEVPYFDITYQRKYREKLIKLEDKKDALLEKGTTQKLLLKSLRQQILQDAISGKLTEAWRRENPDIESSTDLLGQIRDEKERLILEKKIKKGRPSSDLDQNEPLANLPARWAWTNFREVILLSEAGKSLKCTERRIEGSEWGIIKVSAVSWNSFLEDQNKFYSELPPKDISAKVQLGDFLISRANTKELVGKSVIVEKIEKNLLLSDKTIRFKFHTGINLHYMNIYNNSPFARKHYLMCATGSSPSMKNITRSQMYSLLIALPPFPEQEVIVQKVVALMQKCARLEENITKNTQSITMLMRAFSAELFKV